MAFDFPSRNEGFVYDIATGDVFTQDERWEDRRATREALIAHGAITAAERESILDTVPTVAPHDNAQDYIVGRNSSGHLTMKKVRNTDVDGAYL